MEPEKFSRVIGQILGSVPYTMDERNRINEAMGQADSIENMPQDIQQLLARGMAEKRETRLSNVERRIIKDSDQCPLCVANNDPSNVPVHPNCHCDVITDSIEEGVADPDSRFLQPLNRELIDIIIGDDTDLPSDASIQLDPNTAAILDAENVRWADLTRWLQQMEPYLQQGAQFMAIVVDEDTEEAVQEVEELVSTIAEDIEQFPQAIQDRKLWFALAKSVVF